ncbi:MAG TPA: S53 family peptidase [Pseudonocardiaceae bacterium]|nr:S53 family peptidase [Pseudonocardiaceae bacterium]
MRRSRTALLAAVALTAGGASAPTAGVAPSPDIVRTHPATADAGAAGALPLTTAQCEQQYRIACYGPAQLQAAYDLQPLYARGTRGQGTTIAVVDSFGSPTIQHDLAVFDQNYGLPTPKLTVIEPAGKVPAYDGSANRAGWAGETTLDVEWAHAMAPLANIVVVATPTSEDEGTTGFPEIVKAEQYVVDHHLADVISQRFSATEQTFPSEDALLALRGAYQDAYRNGVTVLASSGDSGATDATATTGLFTQPVTSWPDSDPLVTGVGGTKLSLDANGGRTAPDAVWNDSYDTATQRYIEGDDGPNALATGGGRSAVFSRPAYQLPVASVVGDQRGVPDVSMSGSCSGAVNVYQSFAGQPAGWYPTCGTSEASPLFAGIVALAAQQAGHPLGLINPALYFMSEAHAPGLVDVTKGDNTVSFTQDGKMRTVHGFAAGTGYDLVSGVGTVDAALFVPELVSYVDHSS